MNRITILGAGSWGTALSTLLSARQHVTLWTPEQDAIADIRANHQNARYLPGVRLPDCVTATDDLEKALDGAEAVVFAIPSAGMREGVARAAAFVPSNALLVNASKGLEDVTGFRMSQVIADALKGHPAANQQLTSLSGPNLAVEVARGIPTASVAASHDPEAAHACQSLWMGPTFRVYASTDPVGVELAGAMKNVIAIGAGICEGLGYGDNSRAALMTRGLAEITRLGSALGAQESTFLGLAGVGDLIATGGSRLSRNFRVGAGLGAGKKLDDVLREIGQVAEGVPTTRAICLLARKTGVDMPVAEALSAVIFDNVPVRDIITQLMMRPPKDEGRAKS